MAAPIKGIAACVTLTANIATQLAAAVTPFRTLLFEARQKAELTQLELANRCVPRITSKHVSELERGVTQPSLDVAQRLARALEIPITDFDGSSAKAPMPKSKRRP